MSSSSGSGVLRASVIVSTRDRASLLPRLLEALLRQTLPPEAFEVIVVDDGSTDGTHRVLAPYEERGSARVIRLDSPSGPARARNVGWWESHAPAVAFTDDDCEPEPSWLERGLECLAATKGLVMGRTRPRPDSPGYGEHFARTMEVDREDGRYPTCNVFYARRALEAVGGFDESFRYACGEDTDLGWRVREAGYASSFCPDAVVVHDVRPPSFRLFLRERRRFAEQVRLVRRHPHLRNLFHRRYFYRRSHLHTFGVVVLIALALGGSPVFLVGLPVLWADRLRRAKLGSGLGWIGKAFQLVVADLWEFLVFCYASARYRTILL